jgi:hypothetical protein
VLVHAGDRGVHRHDPLHLAFRSGRALDCGQQLGPGAVDGPGGEALLDRVPLPEPFRDVRPRRTHAEPPRDPLHRLPHVHRRTSPPLRRGEQRRQHRPLLVGDLLPSCHGSTLAARHPETVYQHAPAGLRPSPPRRVAVLSSGDARRLRSAGLWRTCGPRYVPLQAVVGLAAGPTIGACHDATAFGF